MYSIFNYYPELKKYIPYNKKFSTIEFKKTFEDTYTLSYSQNNNVEDYEKFKNLIYDNIGKNYFPVMRISDGEMLLLTSFQNESRRSNLKKRLIVALKNIYKSTFYNEDKHLSSHIFGNFDHGTGKSETYRYSARQFTKKESENIKKKFINELKFVSNNGILAIHYSYSEKPSIVEKYWLKFNLILNTNFIFLNEKNCFPFYFVYMFLSESNSLNRIINKKKVLCISSADGSKRKNIMNKIYLYDPVKITWLPIPTSKTFFYNLNLSEHNISKNYDIVFLAAGTGKSNIIKQLSIYNCPIIDCGYIFEVWNNETLKFKRVGCVTDDEY